MGLDGFGGRLRAVRLDRGYTQKQLAGLLGVTEQAVSKWERDTSYPDIGMLDGIAKALDCSLDFLFQLEISRKNQIAQDSVECRLEISNMLLPDIIEVKFGEGLVPVFMEESNNGFPHIKNLRCQIASQWGIVIPAIHLRDQLSLSPEEYQICLNGAPVCAGAAARTDEGGLEELLGRLKEQIFQNIGQVVNNQMIFQMVENLHGRYPYVTERIVPDVISYSALRQVIVHLIKDCGCTASPLILIIQSMETHSETADPLILAKRVAQDLGNRFLFQNWVSQDS